MKSCARDAAGCQDGNKKWKEAVNTELSQIAEYEMFEDKGKGAKVLNDFKLI